MQNTTNVNPQNQANDSLASKNNGASNQQSSTSKGNGSSQSNIFSRSVVSKPQGNIIAASTTSSTAVPTMPQILNNTIEDKFSKSGNSNPSISFGLAPNNASNPLRSNPFYGTINQSNNSSNVLDIFNKNPNSSVPHNTSNTSPNPFLTAQKSQNTSIIFSNNQLTPTFNQVSSNLTINNTSFQANQSPPANLSQLLNKNNNLPIFPPSNQQATGYFSNNTYNTSPSTFNTSFVQSSFQPNTQHMFQNMAITQPNPTSLFNFFNIKLILCHLQQRIGKYCDSRLNDINPTLKERKISQNGQINEFLLAIFQIKTTSDSLKRLKEEMDDLEQNTEQLTAKLEARLESKKHNGLVDKFTWRKLLQDIEEELTLIEAQLYDFIKPLYITHQSGRPITFEDPNVFSIKVAHSIQKKMVKLQASIKELSSQALASAEVILDLEEANSKEAHAMIAQLTEYFEQICIKFELLKERYIAQQQQFSNQRLRQGQAIDSREKSEFFRIENFMRTISKVLKAREATIERRFSKGTTIPSKL